MTTQYDYYQIPATGVPGETKGIAVQSRDFNMKISRFGSLNTDGRRSDDYTRTTQYNVTSEDISHWFAVRPMDEWLDWMGDYTNFKNPYVAGSSVKKILDDQFIRMTMSSQIAGIDVPDFDVMDTNLVDASGLSSGKNWPTEGWHSYGGKYDFHEAYTGGTPPR